jgi:pilus assembly protein CpaD
MIRQSLVLLAALALTACATDSAELAGPEPMTPTERFAIEVQQHPEELRLAAHAQGVSPNQQQALADFVRRYSSGDGGAITLQSPNHGGDPQAAYRTTVDARDFLTGHGVDPAKIRIVGYDAGGDAQAPVVIGYTAFVAKGPTCGQQWENLSATGHNREYENFGCAITANIAAQIGNPSDLLNPRALDPTDAARRQTVLDHYRKGETTSTAKDEQANGAVSTAVH